MRANDGLNTIRFGYASVNGLSLHYAESGEPGRPLILFLHGFPEFWYCWRAQLQVLGADYHCVAPDLPGYNLSSRPEAVERYRAGRLVDDIIAFAQQFAGQRKFTIVAHDWGGALAWALAIKCPDLLDRLVIINAASWPAIRIRREHPRTSMRCDPRMPRSAMRRMASNGSGRRLPRRQRLGISMMRTSKDTFAPGASLAR